MTTVGVDDPVYVEAGTTATIPLEVDGEPPFTVAVAILPEHGEPAVDGAVVTYTPDPGYLGPDSLTVVATDAGGAASDPLDVRIEVVPSPPPDARAGAVAIAGLAAVLLPVVAMVMLREPDQPGVTQALLDALEPHYRRRYTGPDADAAWADLEAQLRASFEQMEPDGSQAQAERVAEMSATAIINHATHYAAQGEESATKSWWTMLDERVRRIHRPMHGVEVPYGDRFMVGSPPVGLDYPGQPNGPPEVWINCRCVLTVSPAVTASAQEATMTEQITEDDLLAFADDGGEYELPGSLQWHGIVAAESDWADRELPIPLYAGPFIDGAEPVAMLERTIISGGLVWGEGAFLDHEAADSSAGLLLDGDYGGIDFHGDYGFFDPGAPFPDAELGFGPMPGHLSGATEGEPDVVTSDTTVAAAVSESDWVGSAARFTPEEWKRSCILHKCDGMEKDCHSLPIREPGGAINRHGVHAAASRIGQVKGASEERIASAKRKLRGAYRQIGEEAPESVAASGLTAARGAGWATNPKGTKRIHDYWTVPGHEGYAKIRWGTPGDFRRLRRALAEYVSPTYLNRVAAQWHHDALGYWPGECGKPGNPPCGKKRGVHAAAEPVAAAATLQALPAEWFEQPAFDGPSGVRIDGQHVYGHIARWYDDNGNPACHVGHRGCTEVPRSTPDYRYFRTGAVLTTDGEVPVGQLTLDTGHPGLEASPQDAKAHYDQTGTAVADVAAGEDEYGIWFSGALRESVTDEQARILMASALSGDWRTIEGNHEMIAALAVNVPGFPIPRAMAASGAVVAVGIVEDGEVVAARQVRARPLRIERAKSVINAERIAALTAAMED